MRSFRDPNNIEWTVFEVRRQVARADQPQTDWQSSGWLCFESTSAKRRLQKYPERWREFEEPELNRLLQQATPAPRTAPSLGDGVEGGSAATGA
jgi:hypothetical protein